MRARTVGPALMVALGGAMMFMPSSTYVGAGASTVTDPCASLPQDFVEDASADTSPEDCCLIEVIGVVDPCIVDTTPDTVVDTTPETTDNAGSGGQIPATGASSNTWLVVLIGGALVVSGSGLLVAGRRKPDTN